MPIGRSRAFNRSVKSAAVIGSGFGGLATAIRLQAQGVKTTVYEQHQVPGGRASVFSDRGYTFDMGPTVVTAPECLDELFRLAGRRTEDYVELIPVSPMYRLHWEDGKTFDYAADEDALLREIERHSPSDVSAYRRYLRYATEVYEVGYERLCHVPFLNFTDMVKVAPDLLRLKAYRSVYDVVARYFKSETLRQAFSFNSLLIGGNPFSASAIYSLIHPLERKSGVFFPRGGMHALVTGLARLFEELGGELRLGARITRIDVEGERVTGVTQDSYGHVPHDVVVSNADVVHTYASLLAHTKQGQRAARKLARREPSMSLFVLYFGTARAYPGLLHHNVMFCSRYEELLKDIFTRGVVADDFSLYVHAPTLTDPSLAPAGGHAFYALSPVPHLGFRRYDWTNGGAERYGERIVDYLDKRYMPGLARDIVTMRTFTPLDFRDGLNAHQGSAFSLAPTLRQSAYFRVHNRDVQLSGLYFVGAGTHPGAGIPGVIGSAKATAGLILGSEPHAATRIQLALSGEGAGARG